MSLLEDLAGREGIRDVINRYCIEADHGRIDRLLDLFTNDAEYNFNDRKYQGHNGIRDLFAESGRRLRVARMRVRATHWMSTSVIDLADGGAASASSYVSVLANGVLDHWGRYDDEFVCTTGRWRIARRRFLLEGAVPDGIGSVLQ
ncbi:hypothetical protein MSAS_17590 [Mycobacterium saskatchewanense]|uniref:SnoaL-like domain-containing protein n=1 Tax=Mycobacterium saskatchewanense TaxID=220927 RepID=A0AAJ3NSV8_9MYCO|nr:nuclear transport factor 2 family protein [Mycobacterium saskatchewanense]ORW72890.1 hypothetical protein AWC23_08515 [Mycobacterium saskatchewanense]BBX62585.1 hypothetical protein MSAS_17590 [Mycobacterium saskatchewanense]